MKADAESNAESDKKRKEEADKINAADSLIFQTEKQLKEYGYKIPADKKEPIETALADLKSAHEARDFGRIDSAMATLNTVFQAASQEMYANTGAEGGEDQPTGSAEGADVGAEDVDFEEVKED